MSTEGKVSEVGTVDEVGNRDTVVQERNEDMNSEASTNRAEEVQDKNQNRDDEKMDTLLIHMEEIFDLAKNGNVFALSTLAKGVLDGRYTLTEPEELFAACLNAANEDPSGDVHYALWEMLVRGIGTDSNSDAANEHFRLAVMKGNKRACSNGALMGAICATKLDELKELREVLCMDLTPEAFMALNVIDKLAALMKKDIANTDASARLQGALDESGQKLSSSRKDCSELRSKLQQKEEELACLSVSRLSGKLAEIREREEAVIRKERQLEKMENELMNEAREAVRFHELRHEQAEKQCRTLENANSHLEAEKATLLKKLHRFQSGNRRAA